MYTMLLTKEKKIEMKNKKTIIFLLNKWKQTIKAAAIHRLYLENIKYSTKNNVPIPNQPDIVKYKPIMYINNIKKRIMEIDSSLDWIYQDYNPEIELTDEDFLELYIYHNNLTIEKIKKILKIKLVNNMEKKVND